jgi:hypothetical protein
VETATGLGEVTGLITVATGHSERPFPQFRKGAARESNPEPRD